MSANHKHGILVALDDSATADGTLKYVANMTSGSTDFRIRLIHLLPPVPPNLLEHGGADDPEAHRELDRKLQEGRREWIAQQEAEAQPLFERALSILEPSVPRENVETECRRSVDYVAIARDCLAAARASDCRTIAIGREALPWYRELFQRHICDEIVKHANGLTVWVVEWDD